jgi:hypothetical protein
LSKGYLTHLLVSVTLELNAKVGNVIAKECLLLKALGLALAGMRMQNRFD